MHQMLNTFENLNIAPFLLSRLSELGFSTPTPIQAQAIPQAIEDKDIIGIAQTGTGKTLAYSIPLIQKLYQTRDKALILVPTRELAYQVRDVIMPLTKEFQLNHVVLIGGESIRPQSMALRKPYNVLIATPQDIILNVILVPFNFLQQDTPTSLGQDYYLLIVTGAPYIEQLLTITRC